MKRNGTPFKNSNTCEGVTFTTENSQLDLAVITINGRYPEQGWVMNETVQELVYIQQGSGKLLSWTGEETLLAQGEVVSVDAGQWFAWEGSMTIIMACNPAFQPQQYKTKE